MACPYSSHVATSSARSLGENYWSYLQLDKLLSSQLPKSGVNGPPVHDEHLFIIIHQAYELWFKQIIHEIDSVRQIFITKEMNERMMLNVIKQTNRVTVILRLLVGQMEILETMTPLDFLDFRKYLDTASGFQSLQFRLLENKLGLKKENRVQIMRNYTDPFTEYPKIMKKIKESEQEQSLAQLVEKWLERTPGINSDGFNFWEQYKNSVRTMLKDEMMETQNCQNESERYSLEEKVKNRIATFDTIFCEDIHEKLRILGERRWSHTAFQGALMISFYRMEPRFNQPFQLLHLLMDIDELLIKWRNNHVQMVQRMIGSNQLGTGGSSGYQYLRSTVSDRYKVFLDLFNLSTFLIPRQYVPPLSRAMQLQLAHPGATKTDESDQMLADLASVPEHRCREQQQNGVC